MLTSRDRFHQVHVAALGLCLIALPWSEFLLSNAQFLLIGNWLVDGIVRRDPLFRLRKAFTAPVSAVFLSFFLLHLLGLLWTDDLAWGTDLCRILLPVLVFGVVLSTSPRLSAIELKRLLLLGAWSTVSSTVVCFLLASSVIGKGGYRELSIFISHIRLALMVCFSVAVFVRYWPKSSWSRIAHLAAVFWSVFFLDRLSSLLGLGLLALLTIMQAWWWSGGMTPRAGWTVRAFTLLLPVSLAFYVNWCIDQYQRVPPEDLTKLELFSAGGERYYHNYAQPQKENGHYVWIYVTNVELQRAWERRSAVPFNGVDEERQPLRGTLVRYMASLGLRKDSLGVAGLSEEDVRRVEHGITSAMAGRRDPVRARIEQVLYELDRYRAIGDPNGHSVTMRFEFLRTGFAIAREHGLFGVGTGDTRPAFAAMYARTNSPLKEEWRLRAHNEYLTLWISFGVLGALWSLFAWWWPAWRNGAFRHPLFIAWAVIFAVSCLSEDTIETQMGATFFALYYALFTFAAPAVPPAERPRVAA